MKLNTALICIFLLLSLTLPQARAAAPAVWLADSMARVPRDAPPQKPGSIAISGARGEAESFQIVVHADSPLTIDSLVISDLVGEAGVIPASAVTLYRQHYVYVRHTLEYHSWWADLDDAANLPEGDGWYADALIPFVDPVTGAPPTGGQYFALPHSVEGGQNALFWVDVTLPRNAAAGTYTGLFTLATDAGEVGGSFTVEVWDFELPFYRSAGSSFQLWNVHTTAANVELMKHNMMPLIATPEDARLLRDEYGLTMLGLGYWSGLNWQACQEQTVMPPPPTPQEVIDRAAFYPPELRLYNQSSDEIDACIDANRARLIEWDRSLQAVDVAQVITMTPTDALMYDANGVRRSAVDVWVVLPIMYDEAPDAVNAALARGEEVWSYAALAQDNYSPKWIIDFAPINHRIMHGFINQSLGMTGFMYWAVDYWSADPWADVNHPFPPDEIVLPAGDGMLFYPGEQVGMPGSIVPSLRAKWIRDGYDDYELLQLLRAAGRTDEMLAISRSVGVDWRDWTRDPFALYTAREHVARLLE
jgi:hypothetical protein